MAGAALFSRVHESANTATRVTGDSPSAGSREPLIVLHRDHVTVAKSKNESRSVRVRIAIVMTQAIGADVVIPILEVVGEHQRVRRRHLGSVMRR